MTTYNIGRKTAARLLDVSVRTVDRYLKADKLTSAKSEGRVWLSKEEILDYLRSQGKGQSTSGHDKKRQHVEHDIIVENRDELSRSQTDNHDRQQQSTSGQQQREPQYQRQKRHQHEVDLEELYEELKQQLAIKEKRLAQASYKIGQLEAQIASMVPQLEFEKQQKLLTANVEEYEEKLQQKDDQLAIVKEEYEEWLIQKEAEKEQLNQIRLEELQDKETIIKKLDEDLHMEKVNKWVYAVILYVLVLGFILIWVALKFI